MASSSAKSKILQFRVDQKFLQQLDGSIEWFNHPDADALDRSAFARDLISVESALLRSSPYICVEAKHFLLITSQGELAYLRGETLRLNSNLEVLPGSTGLSSFWRRSSGRDASTGCISRVAFWDGDRPRGEPLDQELGLDGHGDEIVGLRCHMPKGALVFREGAFFVTDYVQYYDRDLTQDLHDKVEIPVDIPTKSLETIVLVDRGLYSSTKRFGGPRFKPALSFDICNGEGIAFSHFQSHDSALTDNIEPTGGSFPPSKDRNPIASETIDQIEDGRNHLKSRMLELMLDIENDAVLGKLRRAIRDLPEQYLFYRVRWAWPHTGLYLSIKWPKPEPHTESV